MSKEGFSELPKPASLYLLHSEVQGQHIGGKVYYDYTQVCGLMRGYARKMLDEYSEKLCNQLNDAGYHQAEDIVINTPYPL